MAKLKFQGSATGTGTVTLVAPTTDSTRTITLPDETVSLTGAPVGLDSSGGVARATSGLLFNGDTAAANTLDDYEEGTFVCTFTPTTSGSITLNTSYDTLSYTKIGRVVHISGRINISSVSSPVGNTQLNLPFTAASLDKHADYASIRLTCHSFTMDAAGIGLWGEISGGNATYNITEEKRNANWAAYSAANIAGDGSDWIVFDGTYFTN